MDDTYIKKMAQAQEEGYKNKLRKRFGSQLQLPATLDTDQSNEEGKPSDTNSTPVPSSPSHGQQNNSTTKYTPTKLSQTTQTEEAQIPVVGMHEFEVVDFGEKLNLLMSAINTINTSLHMQIADVKNDLKTNFDRLFPRVRAVKKAQQELQVRVDDMEATVATVSALTRQVSTINDTVSTLLDDMAMLKGLSQVYDHEIMELKSTTVDLKARSMANNIIITGILGDDNQENCKEKVLNFLQNKVKMEVNDTDVLVAHRTGKNNRTNTVQ